MYDKLMDLGWTHSGRVNDLMLHVVRDRKCSIVIKNPPLCRTANASEVVIAIDSMTKYAITAKVLRYFFYLARYGTFSDMIQDNIHLAYEDFAILKTTYHLPSNVCSLFLKQMLSSRDENLLEDQICLKINTIG